MAIRAISISPQTAQFTAAATYHWMPKHFKGTVRFPTKYDIPDLLVYHRATQREAYPTTREAIIEGSGYVDPHIGYVICGLAGQPTSNTWIIGVNAPSYLTITKVNGLSTAKQAIDCLITSLVFHDDPSPDGRLWFEYKAVGIVTGRITAPVPTIPASVILRAGQMTVTRNASTIRPYTATATFTQDAEADYTNPASVTAAPFTDPYEWSADDVKGMYAYAYKMTAYSGSSIEAADTAATEAHVWSASRPDIAAGAGPTFTLTIPKVQPADPDEDDEKSSVRQSTSGPILYAASIAGLAQIDLTNIGGLSYAGS